MIYRPHGNCGPITFLPLSSDCPRGPNTPSCAYRRSIAPPAGTATRSARGPRIFRKLYGISADETIFGITQTINPCKLLIRHRYSVFYYLIPTLPLWMIGHSNHSASRFVELLRMHEIATVIDIRTSPKSRFGQFNKRALAERLNAGISYLHAPLLGGRNPLCLLTRSRENWRTTSQLQFGPASSAQKATHWSAIDKPWSLPWFAKWAIRFFRFSGTEIYGRIGE